MSALKSIKNWGNYRSLKNLIHKKCIKLENKFAENEEKIVESL